MKKGTLNVVVGKCGNGKSITLLKFAKMEYNKGRNVLYLNNELTNNALIHKFNALDGIEFALNIDTNEKIDNGQKILCNHINPFTIDGIVKCIKDNENDGNKFDTIFVDNVSLIKGNDVVERLKSALCDTYKLVVSDQLQYYWNDKKS